MKILIISWNSYGDIEPVLRRRNAEIIKFRIDKNAVGEELEKQKRLLEEAILGSKPDYVFSYNYFIFVSQICAECDVKYVSWIYDSPFMDLYHPSIINPTNYVFVFDYGVYHEFANGGINTVYYLPLGVDIDSINKLICTGNGCVTPKSAGNEYDIRRSFDYDVSFVGSLYTEKKHNLYDKFSNLPGYEKGYLDALILAQKNIYGDNIFENLLTDDMIRAMQACYPTDPDAINAMTPRQIYSQYVLSRKVTSIERLEILKMLGELNTARKLGEGRFALFTHEKDNKITGWINKGELDYYSQMHKVFNLSKINLNITLRSIQTGIPLRAFDIMAAGGFLITNYQAEFAEYFVPGEDIVIYDDYQDLCSKVEYYLSHEKEREEIALNGYQKVVESHNLMARIDEIERIVMG